VRQHYVCLQAVDVAAVDEHSDLVRLYRLLRINTEAFINMLKTLPTVELCKILDTHEPL
jgi:hypothetical protein